AKCADRTRRTRGFFLALAAEVSPHRRFIFCGTFRSRASKRTFVRRETQPPGVTRRVALSPEEPPVAASKGRPNDVAASDFKGLPLRSSLAATSRGFWSPDFPPARFPFESRTGDHPAHPLR